MTSLLHSLLLVSLGLPLAAAPVETDICVYGGTSSGVIAAVQVKHLGKSVILLEPGGHLGGLTSGGLGFTDIGNKSAIGGRSREFYRALGRHYGKEEAWTFEPGVAERQFQAIIAEAGVPVVFQQRLATVKKEGAQITEITCESGATYRAKMFIDCTYEGDLMAKAAVAYHVGREANATYGETLNGIRGETPKHQFKVPVDPFIRPGDPSSGLLPFVQDAPFFTPGEGDKSVQAYNYRLCLTKNAANKMPIEPLGGYEAGHYELLGRYCDALGAAGVKVKLGDFIKFDMVTPEKTDINNNGGFSTDWIGMNHGYPEADHATREKIARDHLDYVRGFLIYLATSPRVPAAVRAEMQEWGLCHDEFVGSGGWPHQMYVREARRLISDYVMTEKNCRAQETIEDSIGLAAYNMDSHNCRRIVRNGRVQNEGDVQVPPMKPYPISYRSIIPKRADCENLLVPVCLAASHIAYGSIRMEPVFMITGESAATAAVLALEANVALQEVAYPALREKLLEQRQILDWPR